jgi:hypothetical protein
VGHAEAGAAIPLALVAEESGGTTGQIVECGAVDDDPLGEAGIHQCGVAGLHFLDSQYRLGGIESLLQSCHAIFHSVGTHARTVEALVR